MRLFFSRLSTLASQLVPVRGGSGLSIVILVALVPLVDPGSSGWAIVRLVELVVRCRGFTSCRVTGFRVGELAGIRVAGYPFGVEHIVW